MSLPPSPITMDGILAMRHFPGLVKMGDALAMQATVS